VPSHSADRSSSHVAAVAVPALEDSLAAAVPASPGHSAAGNGDDLTTATARNSPVTADDEDDVTGKAPSARGAYIYGFDSSGNPTLTDSRYYGISDGMGAE
jgi:hypothetical protein